MKKKSYWHLGNVYRTKKAAVERKQILDKSAIDGNLNLRHSILKRGTRYILSTSSKRRSR